MRHSTANRPYRSRRLWLAGLTVAVVAGTVVSQQTSWTQRIAGEPSSATQAEGRPSAVPVVQAAVTRPVELPASADTYVIASRPSANRGDRRYLYATRSENRTFVRFETARVVSEGQVVLAAALRVYVLRSETTAEGLEAHPLAGSWSESAVTAGNRPPHDEKAVSPAVPVTGARRWITVPIAVEAVSTTGPTSLELLHRVTGTGLQLASRESGRGPVLSLTLGAAGTTATTTTTTTTTTRGSKVTREAPRTPGVRPFDLPSAGVLAASKRLAFAHYFPPFPLSIDNKAPSSDYYAEEYLDPRGESGKHAAYGGFLRDRPLGRSPLSGDYVSKDLESEVRQARAAGLDGFAVDILSLTSRNWTRTVELLEAAHRVDPSFKIMLMPDMTTLDDETPAALATAMDRLGGYPAAYRLADGRLVISPFKAENKSASWWKDWLQRMRSTHGTEVAFVPTFLDWQSHSSDFSAISYGFSHWGTANPESASGTARHTDKAQAMGKLWMAPVRVQDVRPNQGIYDEAGGTETLRRGWQGVIEAGAEWVHMPTWNDYIEGSAVAPSAGHGWSFLDISAYYLTRWKTGRYPEIERDGLYLVHRRQPHTAKPTFAQTKLMTLRSGGTPARDRVEVVAFLTEDARVTVTVGGTTHTWDAEAGLSTRSFPLSTGTVSARAVRGGAVTAEVESPFTITSRPQVQDLAYRAVSSLR